MKLVAADLKKIRADIDQINNNIKVVRIGISDGFGKQS